MDEPQIDVVGAVDKAEAAKQRLKTDPDAVRKILQGNYEVSDSVTLFPRKDLNKRYADIRPKFDRLAADSKQREGESDEEWNARIIASKEQNADLFREFEEIQALIEESAVTFTLVSVSKRAIKSLRREARKKFPVRNEGNEDPDEAEERDEWYQSAIIAAHLAADGYTVDDILKIKDEWPTTCWASLWVKAQELSIQDDYLRGSFTPDFS